MVVGFKSRLFSIGPHKFNHCATLKEKKNYKNRYNNKNNNNNNNGTCYGTFYMQALF